MQRATSSSTCSTSNSSEEEDVIFGCDSIVPQLPAEPFSPRGNLVRSSTKASMASAQHANGRKVRPSIIAIARPFAELPELLQHSCDLSPNVRRTNFRRSITMLAEEELYTSGEEGAKFESQGISTSSSVTRDTSHFRRWLFLLLEEPFGSGIAWILSLIFISANLLALLLLCNEHLVRDTALWDSGWGNAIVVVSLIGTLEGVLRFTCSPRRRRSLAHTPNFIDVSCMIPFWVFRVARLDSYLECPSLFLLCRMEFVLRLLKLCRYFSGWHLLYSAITDAASALMLPLEALVFIMGVGACAILIAEEAAVLNGEGEDPAIIGFPSALRFALLCVVSITAGPFYDLTLQSDSAQLVVGFLMTSALVVFAMPMSIIGTCFCQVWFQRHRLLFLQAVRRRVERETPEDTQHELQHLFDRFNGGHPELGLSEFRAFVSSIAPNTSMENVLSIFECFDQDQDGCVSFQELHAAVFPEDADLEFLLDPFRSDYPSDQESVDNEGGIPYHSHSSKSSQGSLRCPVHLANFESRIRALEHRQLQSSFAASSWCTKPLPMMHALSTRRSTHHSPRCSVSSFHGMSSESLR